MEDMELNLNEMEDATGGKRHFKPLADKPGWTQHKVSGTDTLIKIANKYKIADWRKIIDWNPHIDRKTNLIRTGEYLWIKQ